MPNMPSSHSPCNNSECIPYVSKILSSYLNLMHLPSMSCKHNDKNMSRKHNRAKTASPPKVRKETPTWKPKGNLKASEEKKESVNEKQKHVIVASDIVETVKISKSPGPKCGYQRKLDP